MRTVNKKEIGQKLAVLLDEENPIDEDIGILDEFGKISAAVITKAAYEFFLAQVEAAEDRVDLAAVREFHESGEKNKYR